MKIVMILVGLILSCQCNLLHKTLNLMQDHQNRVTRRDKNGDKMVTKEKSALPTMQRKRRITRQSKGNNSLLFVAELPKPFSGNLSDIPETVRENKPGSVVKDKDIQYVWRFEESPGNCYIACKHETMIACKFYLYADKKCIMTEQDYLKLEKLENAKQQNASRNTTSKQGITKSKDTFAENQGLYALKQIINQIENRLETSIHSLQSGSESHESHMRGLQNKQNYVQKTLNLLRDKVRMLNDVNPELIKKVEAMDSRQEDLVEEIQSIGEYENQIASALNNVDYKVVNLDKNMNAIKLTNAKIFRQLIGEESSNPEYNKNIIELRRQMMKLVSKIEMNPTLIKMSKNQRVLSKALEAVDREIIINERRLTHLDDSTSSWGGRLIAEEEHRKVLNDALQSLSNVVKNARNDIIKLRSPQSSENAERNKKIRQMRSDIQILEKSNAKLEQDMFHAKEDLTRLVRDLVSVQVSAHNSKTSVIALVEANKNMALDFHQLKTDQNQMITQIQTLATVYQSVLAALHSLEMKQIKVMHHLGRYENQMRSLSNEFLGDGKIMGSDSIGSKQMFREFPLLLTMKNFQTKLLKQVYQLKSNLNKVEQHLHMEHEQPAPAISTMQKDVKQAVNERKDYPAWKHGPNSPDLFGMQGKPKIPGANGFPTGDNVLNSPNLFSFQQKPKDTRKKRLSGTE